MNRQVRYHRRRLADTAAAQAGIKLTESFAMWPGSAVSGQTFVVEAGGMAYPGNTTATTMTSNLMIFFEPVKPINCERSRNPRIETCLHQKINNGTSW